MRHAVLAACLFGITGIGAVTTLAVLPDAAEAQQAAAIRPFTTAAFAEAQAAGRPILVDVYAPWCPVCRAQEPGIRQAMQDRANEGLVVFRIDFDDQKAEQRALRVTGQSTLIAFRGRQETGRIQGVTDASRIAALVATTRS
jgi:thioredoxin 1